MRGASDVICVLIQPVTSGDGNNATLSRKQIAQITSALAAVNRTLLPPLRISWARVGILQNGMAIPYTSKGTIFRKKLEILFGDFLAGLLENVNETGAALRGMNDQQGQKQPQLVRPVHSRVHHSSAWKTEEVERLIVDTIAPILGIGSDSLRASSDTTFAEVSFD